MKKLIPLILALALCLSLSACGAAAVPQEDFDALSTEYSVLEVKYEDLLSDYSSAQKELESVTEQLNTANVALDDANNSVLNLQNDLQGTREIADGVVSLLLTVLDPGTSAMSHSGEIIDGKIVISYSVNGGEQVMSTLSAADDETNPNWITIKNSFMGFYDSGLDVLSVMYQTIPGYEIRFVSENDPDTVYLIIENGEFVYNSLID